MSKDPAVLLYIQDFLVGTSLLTALQKGHYITLLCYQQQSATGSLPPEQVKALMGKDFNKQWPVLKAKFDSDENGFYNKRMRKEILKRKEYSKKQSERVKKRYHGTTVVPTAVLPSACSTFLANENENENIKGGLGEKWNQRPGPESLDLPLDPVKAGSARELLLISKGIKVTDAQIESLWSVFKAQYFTGEKYYQSEHEAQRHFINWVKGQNITEQNIQTASPSNHREDKARLILSQVK